MSKTQSKAPFSAFKTLRSPILKLIILILAISPCFSCPLEHCSVQIEPREKESFGPNYQINLKKVAFDLNLKWNRWFKVTPEKLNLKITNINDKIMDEKMNSLFKDIITSLEENNLLNLYGLEILCPHCSGLTDKSLTDFATTFSNKSLLLEYLHLDFDRCMKFTDKSFQDFTTALSTHPLYTLKLNFRLCTQLTEKSLTNLALTISNSLIYLGHLNLNFYWCDGFTDQSFIALSSALPQSLQALHLNFGMGSLLTDNSLKSLAHVLSTRSIYVNALHLEFLNDNLTDKALVDLAKAISNPSIQSLNLNFGFCKNLTDESLIALATAIHSHSTLKSLRLDFKECQQLTGNSLLALATAIRTLSLQSLDLIFTSCKNLTEQALADLMIAIPVSIPSLNLDFSQIEGITDKVLENLATVISSPEKHLQSLRLSLIGCKNLTDQSFEHFATAVPTQSLLKSLDLDFSSSGLTHESVENLAAALYSAPKLAHLQYLSLYFNDISRGKYTESPTVYSGQKAMERVMEEHYLFIERAELGFRY